MSSSGANLMGLFFAAVETFGRRRSKTGKRLWSDPDRYSPCTPRRDHSMRVFHTARRLMSLTPRDDLPLAQSHPSSLAGGRCDSVVYLVFYVRRGHRRQSVMSALIVAALKAAR